MNKTPANKGKVALFVIGATVANILLMAICFVLLMLLYSALLSKILPAEALIWAIAVAFILALLMSTLIYRRLLKLLRERYHLDEYLGLNKK
ncbi:MAG: hypothetical protein ABFC85_00210 [Rectinema sp.]